MKPEEWGGQKVDRTLLTPINPHDMMESSNGGDAPTTKKGAMVAKKKAEVIEEVEEVDGDSEMLTAKAAAAKLGTDARTLRKFLRKENGTVGQGQRWEIDPAKLPALKEKFDAWAKGGQSRSDQKKSTKVKEVAEDIDDEPVDAELDGLEEIEELEDLDFDD